MRAEFKDGVVKELPKDCSCLDHNGPHWVYADHLYRTQNRKISCFESRAKEEVKRLERKRGAMVAKGIVQLFIDDGDLPAVEGL